MKTLKIGIFFVAVLGLLALCAPAWAIDGMISYWRFDEGIGTTAYDSFGDNHGTIYGATWTNGQVDGALSFDGVNDYIEIPDSSTLDITDSITLEVWINIDSAGLDRNRAILRKGTHILTDGYTMDHDINYEGFPGNGIQVCSGSSDVLLEFGFNIVADRWYHVTYTYDGSMERCYMDGALVNSRESTHSIPTNDLPLHIGHLKTSTPHEHEWWDGKLDEVAIYNRALTPEEIQQHYQNGLSGMGYTEPSAIEAMIDIDPDTLNLNSRGKWITCYIELPEGYDVDDIDVGSILLEYLLEVQHSDVQDDVLMVKFDRQDVIAYIELVLEIELPTDVTLMVTGELTDETPFEGTDTIRVIDEGGEE